MSKVDISIIVPVYNVEEYLAECVNSLLAQTKKEIEIILVDDGSTDMSGSICDEYAEKYPNIYVIHQENMGQSIARNKGVQHSKGKYILYLDSDDYIDKRTCEVLFDAAIKTGSDIVRGDMIGHKRETENDGKTVITADYLASSIKNKYYDIVAMLDLVKKEVLHNRNIKFIENCFYEDQEYTLKLLLDDKTTITKISFPFYFYRSNPNSTTHIHTRKKGSDFIKVISAMQGDIEQRNDLKNYYQYSGTVLAYAVWHFKEVWLHLSKKDRKELHSEFSNILKKELLYIKHMAKTKQLELKLFIYTPKLLKLINSFIDMLRDIRIIKKLYHQIKGD